MDKILKDLAISLDDCDINEFPDERIYYNTEGECDNSE